MPTTTNKPRQFAFILAEDEHEMLRELAEKDGRSAANWLRMVIRREHGALAPVKTKARKGGR
jgi:hypothetical protein